MRSEKGFDCVRDLNGHTKYVNYVIRIDNGEILSVSRDGTLKTWNMNTGECLQTIETEFSMCMIGL